MHGQDGIQETHVNIPVVKHNKLTILMGGKVLKWIKQHPSGYTYVGVELPTCLAIISDSAFKSDGTDSLSTCGRFICICEDHTVVLKN